MQPVPAAAPGLTGLCQAAGSTMWHLDCLDPGQASSVGSCGQATITVTIGFLRNAGLAQGSADPLVFNSQAIFGTWTWVH